MPIVVFLLTFNCILVASYLHLRWKHARHPEAAPIPKRLTGAQLRSFGFRQILFVVILAYSYSHRDWTAASVGVHNPDMWLESILAGEIAFIGLVLAYALCLRVAGIVTPMRLAAARGNLTAWPRRRVEKIIAVIFIMVFNPFTEELVMRGILIHHWALQLGSPVVPIAVGFALNALLHLYQGWRMQLWHALYFAMAVGLLYSPWGLTAAITAHVFGDTLPFLHLRRNLLKARAARRASIQRPTT